VLAVRCHLSVTQAITDAGEEVARALELAAYFTHCNLQPAHLMLALKTAMASAFKVRPAPSLAPYLGPYLATYQALI
jgi:coatomer protein complex subunit alpha (xenin)